MPCLALFSASPLFAQQQPSPPTPAVSIKRNFGSVNRRLLAMAEDFPAEKYDYRPTKDVRSFGEVIVHAMSGNVYVAKAGRGEKVKWDELDAKNYKGKAEIVSALKKSIADADATLNALPDEQFTKTLGPWMGVIEHSAEHYGQLVVYYRLSGLVPPESRPKSKTN
ncbi:MAG TPA: DinB family protein [Myxococcaceae bacterium]|nr:DinB family protein [Myxococcaceae bacterium]